MGNINLMIAVVVVFGIFLLLREFWCWYFKINKIAQLLDDQLKEQKRSNELLRRVINNGSREVNKQDK